MRGKLAKTLVGASFVVLMLAVLGLSIWDYSQELNGSIAQQAQDYLKESAYRSVETMQIKMDEYEANTKAVAYMVSWLDGKEIEEIVSLMALSAKELELPRLAYTLPDGSSYSSDGLQAKLGLREYVKRALLGESVVSDVLISMFDGNEVFVIAVPVVRDGNIVAVLHSTYFTSSLHPLITSQMYDSKGTTYLVRSDGYMISRPQSKNLDSVYPYDNMFEYMRNVGLDMDRVIDIQHDLRKKDSGFVKYGFPNDSYYMNYHSTAINDWFVFHMIPSHLVDMRSSALFLESMQLVFRVIVVVIGLLSFAIYFLWKTRLQVENNKNQVEFINSNIQGGLYKCGAMGSGYFDYVSDGFLRLVGYTREEMAEELRNLFMEVVYEEDKVKVRQMRKEAFDYHSTEPLTSEYRIRRKDGSVIWVLDRGQFLIDEDGIPWFYSIMLDHTQQKTMVDELHYNEQRYRIIVEQSSSIIFDYDYRSQVIDLAPTFQSQFGYEIKGENFPESELFGGRIHMDDAQTLKRLFMPPLLSDPVKKAEIRILNNEKEYIWCRFTMTTIFDDDGIATKGIGRIVNIDSQKRDIDVLMRKAQTDELTGLYNKTTSQELVETILMTGKKEMHAMFVIDIDDFKQVNDTRGHLVGDHVLADVGQILKGIARSTDIVGRMGGDEFLVFLRDVTSREAAIQKARDICSHLELYQVFHDGMSHITCSIGIALSPLDGSHYVELFTKADKALYKVKNSGKNRYYLYTDTIANQQYVASRFAAEDNQPANDHEDGNDHEEILKHMIRG